MAHPNEDLLRRGFDAFGRGDMEVVAGIMADDIVWHFPGRSQLAGDHEGKDAVLAWLGRNLQLSGGTLRVEPHDILANDEHGVALIRVTAQREGKSIDQPAAQVMHLRDGKITETWVHPADIYAADAFWG